MNNNIPESVRKRVIIKELVKGKKAATKLKFLLQNEKNPFGDASLLSYKLASNVLRSFTEALSIVSQPGCDNFLTLLNSGENGSPVVIDAGIDPPSGDSAGRAVKKSSRGCYKRRKCGETWSIVSQTIVDNHSWRKYGQKRIMNFEYPRSYFRCAFKHEQGCLAIKQMQKTQDNPDMYQITYIGTHTCNTTNVTDEQKQELMESDDIAESALVFGSLAMEFGDIDFHFD
ncbi:unnamed protein product [Lathyrus sativus]|nr:unnamed protein product [Lathyrus sativus]